MPDFLEIIKNRNFTEVQRIFQENKPKFDIEQDGESSAQMTAYNQYEVKGHKVLNTLERKKKQVYKPVINELTGEVETDSNGNQKVIFTEVEVNRVPLPFQRLIVERRVGFLLGNKITYQITMDEDNQQEQFVVDFVERIQLDCKMDYRNKEVARRMMSELECAELWYLVEDTGNYWTSIAKAIGIKKPKYQLKMKILSPALRDNLYPLYNEYGDMIAFARGYRTKEEGKEVEHFDVYTADFSYKYINRGSWALDKNAVGGGIIKNSTGKIPVIYHLQSKPEWSDVQGMIERLETLLSNHGDMNDYFGEPILAIFGQLIQAINKGESGKIMQLSENAKASFLALDSPPESIKMEVENLEKFIYAMSQTPNISFEQMKDIGQLSGIALTLMFLDAHMAAVAKEETFGSGVQRRVNLIKAYIGNVLNVGLKSAAESVFMKPVFTPYMPIDIEGLITTLSQATNAGYVSKETAAEKLEDAGYIESAEREYERLADQRKNESRVGLTFGEA